MNEAARNSRDGSPEASFKPCVPPNETKLPEFTFWSVLIGTILGIIFSASSMYLVLKVGMTVSASIPIAVLSISLFRAFSLMTGMRRATILENNMVQTTGSAGESIAFGVGVMTPFHIIADQANWNLFTSGPGKPTVGLNKGVLGGEFTPELLGVGYIIGPRIACITVAGGIMAYLVVLPTIAMFGEYVPTPIFPSETALIRDMGPGAIRNFYVLYIGAGAVATGGIISMARAMPVIISALVAGLKDMLSMVGSRAGPSETAVPRTERDLSVGI